MNSIGNIAEGVGDLKVIGRQSDTANYIGQPGYDVLNVDDWSMAVNYNWVQDGIDSRQIFYAASDINSSTLRSMENGWGTVFSQEIDQLYRNGYSYSGSYFYPGDVYSGSQYMNGIGAGYNASNEWLSGSNSSGGYSLEW